MLQLLGDVPRTDRHAAGAVWDGPQDRPSLGYQEEYQEEYREDYREDYRKDDVRAGREQLLDEFTGLKAACDRGGREQLASEGTAAERAVLERAGRRLDELAEAAAAAAAEAEAKAEAAEATEEAEAAEAQVQVQAGEAAADEDIDADEDEAPEPELGAVRRGTRKQRKAKARHAAVRAAIGLDDEYDVLGEGVAAQ